MAFTDNLKNIVDWLALILLLVGGINWGLVGVFDFNLVEAILGGLPALLRVTYTLVGISALVAIGRMIPEN